MRVVVVGGGVSGLAAAHALVTARPSLDVTVLEAAERTGGMIDTERRDGFIVERGPDSMITDKPAGLRLATKLGLEPLSTRKTDRGAYVVRDGRLARIPEGFSLMAPLRVRAFLASPILSPAGRARALAEVTLPRAPKKDDESLASFVTRRFGKELLDRLAQPLVSGIYGADPQLLSLRATMPRFLDAEETGRSVTLELRRRARAIEGTSGVRYGLFVSFADGMAALPRALTAALGARVRTGARVVDVARREAGGFRVALHGSEALTADAVVLALPPRALGRFLVPFDAKLADLLDAIPLGSAATVTFAARREHVTHPLDAFGWVTPRIEQRASLASTWASTKFEGRAPPGHVLLRVFVGERHQDRDDDGLALLAREELRRLVGWERGGPLFTTVVRSPRALPQYQVGHLARVADAERREAAIPGLALAGIALRGVGIPDAIASGERAAERILAHADGLRS